MITDDFDKESLPLFSPEQFYGRREKIADVCLVTFSFHVRDAVTAGGAEVVAQVGTANGKIDIWSLGSPAPGGRPLLFFMSPIGANIAGTILHEVHVLTGATKFVYFGSCGVLQQEQCRAKVIVPTEAYRDEGFSYHYLEKSDWVTLTHAPEVAVFLAQNNIPYVMGRCWTTDAIYRETACKVARRREQGCLCVEMEAAGLEAVCRHLGLSYYGMLFGGDVLAETWSRGDLGGEREKGKQTDLCAVARAFAETLCR